MSGASPDRLWDTVAIVTGGAGGIGRATCLALAAAGAKVVAADVNAGALDETLTELQRVAGGPERCLRLLTNVSSETDVQRMVHTVAARFGRIDALVCCAGIPRPYGSGLKPMAQVAPAEWDEVVDINLKGIFLSNRAVLPIMMKQRRGDIVNVSSVLGRQGQQFASPYCASKFGVIGMSESLSEEVSGTGIRIQVLLPGAVVTSFWKQNNSVPMPADALPPERIASMILFMLVLPPDATLVAPVLMPAGRLGRGDRAALAHR